jgi:hypothetical protein
MAAELFNQFNNLVHGSACTLVIPGALLVASTALFAYRHATEEQYDLPLAGFLGNILAQMCPLIALKVKIYMCGDRMSLVPLVLVKTLLMHIILLSLRITSQCLANYHLGKMQIAFDAAILCGCMLTLKYVIGFNPTPAAILQHTDVRNLVILAAAAATCSEGFFVVFQPSWMSESSKIYSREGLVLSKVMFVTSNYVDIVAFMPVVWRLWQVENESDDFAVGTTVSEESKRQVKYFFLFVIGFYSWDDVIDPIMTLMDEPIAMMAHAAHFCLLLDFACFFLFQVSSPNLGAKDGNEKLMRERGEQLQGLLSENGMDDD